MIILREATFLNRSILAIGLTTLFIISVVTPMTLGYDVETSEEQPDTERGLYPEYYDCYSADEIDGYVEYQDIEVSSDYKPVESNKPLDASPPMDSPWPMYCHDVRHTGRSPYSTVDTWDEIWRFKQDKNDFVRGSSVIGDDGTIYFGAADIYALYPNGTMKWKSDEIGGYVWSTPAIDENGIIYIGTVYDFSDGNYLYAFYPNGTLKWKFFTGDVIFSSPVISDDGTIYFGHGGNPSAGYINAVYPNGTLRWRFKTNHAVYSSPAIGGDGTIYCGSHDTYLYALYPNNGTLKWKYKTGDWIRTSPCIADDGTIYVVSLDNYLHAVNPNGTEKWKTDVGAGTSPTIGHDGTIYCGYKKLHAVNPVNGSVKWTLNAGGKIKGATPCNSIDGFIYFGTEIGDYGGGDIVAVNPNGTERWRYRIANQYVDSAPAIAEDGTIYVGSAWDEGGYSKGYLHAFGWCELEADANGPYYGQINESIQFQGSAKGGYRPYSYYWDFGDGNTSDEEDPIHIYKEAGNHTVVFTVTDNTSNTSSDTSWALVQEANYPPDKPDIDGPTSVKVGQIYNYSFNSTDPNGDIIWYHLCWGDKEIIYIYGPYHSGEELTLSYTWTDKGTYTINCWARDVYDEVSDTATLEVEVPRNRVTTYLWYQWFLERFPILEVFLRAMNLLR